jgi:alpha-L-rhamnosidase
MTSFNHYALGAVADWLHRTVAGLAPAAPGYKQIEFRPRPGGSLTFARARHRTPYGLASCSWKIENDTITVEVEVPPNALGRVSLPGEGLSEEGLSEADGQLLEIGSGKYRWSYPYQQQAKPRPVLTLDSTLGDLIDQPEVYARVRNLFILHNEEFADRLDGQMEVTLREAIFLNPRPEELSAKIESALAPS